jgi:hypothetical protein
VDKTFWEPFVAAAEAARVSTTPTTPEASAPPMRATRDPVADGVAKHVEAERLADAKEREADAVERVGIAVQRIEAAKDQKLARMLKQQTYDTGQLELEWRIREHEAARGAAALLPEAEAKEAAAAQVLWRERKRKFMWGAGALCVGVLLAHVVSESTGRAS